MLNPQIQPAATVMSKPKPAPVQGKPKGEIERVARKRPEIVVERELKGLRL